MASLTKPCRWCSRSRSTPNPLDKTQGEFLKFVPSQNLCNTCRYVLSLAYNTEDKQKLHTAVAVDPHPRREEFMSAVRAWEEAHNASASGHVRYKEFRCVFDSRLEATQTDSFEVEEILGHLWPSATYESFFKEPVPASAKLTSVTHKGQKVVGVLMDPNKGWAPGVLKVSQHTRAALTSTTEMGRKSEELRPGQLADLRKQQLAELKQDVLPDADGDGMLSLKRKATIVQQHGDVSDDEDSCFAIRLVPRLAGSAGSSGSKGSGSGTSRKSAGSWGVAASPADRKRARPDTGADPASGAKPKGARLSQEAQALKQEQELNAIDVALLEGDQFMALLSKQGLVMDLSVASRGKSVIKRLEARSKGGIAPRYWGPACGRA